MYQCYAQGDEGSGRRLEFARAGEFVNPFEGKLEEIERKTFSSQALLPRQCSISPVATCAASIAPLPGGKSQDLGKRSDSPRIG
jgi:hypothetical protein